MGPMQTRTGMEAFQIGDSIGVYAVPRPAGSTLPSLPERTGNLAHNAKWVKTADGWQPASSYDIILWDKEGRPMDFYAYYPFSADALDPQDLRMAVEAEQNSKASFLHSDWLRATNTEGLSKGTVCLKFDHMFAALDVCFDKGDVKVNGSKASVVLSNVVTEVSLDLGKGTMTPKKTGSVVFYPQDRESMHYQGIVPPQKIADGQSTIMLDNVSSAFIFQVPQVQLRRATIQRFSLSLMHE